MNTPLTDTGTIRFISGIVNTTAANLLTMAPGSVVSNASNASFVNGPVKKVGNTDFTFPVGKTGFGYVPIGVSNFAGAPATDEFTAEYMRGNARLLGPVTAIGLDHVSGCDYWILNRTGSATATDITAYWSANNVCSGTYVDNLGDLVIAHFDGTNWDAFGTVGTATGAPAAGNVVWTGVTNFSPFALASVSFNNPLPITINFFTGMKQNGNHLLNWKVTCNSSPTANMVLERSSNGRNYSGIYTKTATALQCQQPFNYTDAQPTAGVNYYRLKMTDASGKVTYSSVVTLINATRGIDVMHIAPNPIVGGKFSLRVSAAQNGKMDVIVTDMQGRMMQRQSTSLLAGFNQVPVNVSSLAAGSYQVSVMTSEGRASVQRFVIQ
ncbi:MAG: T9SS type A sorting domain-containing protein [Chitinophagaceae bacterium]|nr:T9SS type A sorting domain-containing protein [Chitinophagaceae bacterium]